MSIASLIVFLVAPVTLAQLGSESNPQVLFQRLDVDRNGQLEQSELPDRLQPAFRSFDSDRNNSLSLDELSRAVERIRERRPQPSTAGGSDEAATVGTTDPYALYKPSSDPIAVQTMELIAIHDDARDKDLQLRINYPETGNDLPVIVFSHGAWGTKDHYQPLTRFWASHGYVTIQPNHADSRALGTRMGDTTVFRDWAARPADVSFLLDSLAALVEEHEELRGRVNLQRIGIGGHSYGASTAQLIAGTDVRGLGRRDSYRDDRVSAAILMSGQGPGGLQDENSWKPISIPMLVMSGTADGPTRTGDPAESRKLPYELSPPGDKYLVWVEGLDHGYGNITGSDRHPVNAAHVAYTQAATLAFWDAYLRDSQAARDLLQSDQITEQTAGEATLLSK